MMDKIKNHLYCFLIILGAGMLWAAPVRAQMIKEVVFGLFLDAPSEVEADRFYMRYHAPETIRISGPWIRRYESYKPYDPPEEAVKLFGAVKGRYAELWFASEEDYHSRPSHGAWSLPSWETDKTRKMPKGAKYATTVPALPTEEFYDPDPNPEQTTIVRWVQAIRYPDGVSVEDGEKWFLQVHAKEALKQPGLLKFISYKCLEKGGIPAGSKGTSSTAQTAQMPSGAPPSGSMPSGSTPPSGGMQQKSWVRIVEYWYKDLAAWRKAVIESPPSYTAPSWGGTYPFVEMGSTFIGYTPDIDFLKGNYIVP
jgi:hypothetical protein